MIPAGEESGGSHFPRTRSDEAKVDATREKSLFSLSCYLHLPHIIEQLRVPRGTSKLQATYPRTLTTKISTNGLEMSKKMKEIKMRERPSIPFMSKSHATRGLKIQD